MNPQTSNQNMAIDKIAETEYPVQDLLRQRWSPLAFSDKPVEPEKLRSVLEAARWASSSFNEQPWSFIVATKDNPAEFDRLLSCLAEGNQEWARVAPVLMVSVAKLNFERNGNPNRHASHDVGSAEANLAVQATALGLYIHQMAGFDAQKVRETYQVPEGYEPLTAISLGYLGDPNSLSERLLQREQNSRTRKPIESFVFSQKWGEPSPIVES